MEKIAKEVLLEKIEDVKKVINSASDCLLSKDYTQCAVRLEMCGEKFTPFEMAVFEEVDNKRPS